MSSNLRKGITQEEMWEATRLEAESQQHWKDPYTNVQKASNAELTQHPAYKQMLRDIEQKRLNDKLERDALTEEQFRLRQEGVRIAKESLTSAIEKYEVMRKEMHAQLHRIWIAEQAHHQVAKGPSNLLSEQVFMGIDIPTLLPTTLWNTGFTTTRVSVMAYMGSAGKAW